jgi:hypothetical protein
VARPTGPFLQGFGCGDDQHADASGDVGAVGDVAGAGQAQVTLGFDLAVSCSATPCAGGAGGGFGIDGVGLAL